MRPSRSLTYLPGLFIHARSGPHLSKSEFRSLQDPLSGKDPEPRVVKRPAMEALAAFEAALVLSLKVNRGRLGTACKLARRRQPQPPLEGPPQQPVPRDSPLLCALDLAQASSADVFAELTGAFCNDTAPTRVQASRLVVEAARERR